MPEAADAVSESPLTDRARVRAAGIVTAVTVKTTKTRKNGIFSSWKIPRGQWNAWCSRASMGRSRDFCKPTPRCLWKATLGAGG